MRLSIFCFCAGCCVAAGAAEAPAEKPVLRFGVVADPQYADKETIGKRRYREAAGKLKAALKALDKEKPDFIVNLGDVIDGNGERTPADLALIAGIFREARSPLRHVLGNHCLVAGRQQVMQALGMKDAYYEFRCKGWRFLVLDGMDVSTFSPKGSPEALRAGQILALDPKLPTYNGALSDKQLAWLEERLADANRQKERVIVFCHHPTVLAASTQAHLLWNHVDVEAALAQSHCVAAYLCGHDHAGGYACADGIQHLTMPGLCEAPAGDNAYALVEVYQDRMVISGFGTVPGREVRW